MERAGDHAGNTGLRQREQRSVLMNCLESRMGALRGARARTAHLAIQVGAECLVPNVISALTDQILQETHQLSSSAALEWHPDSSAAGGPPEERHPEKDRGTVRPR